MFSACFWWWWPFPATGLGPQHRRAVAAALWIPRALLVRVLVVATVATMPWGLIGLSDSDFAWSAVGSNLGVGVGGTGGAYVAAATLIGPGGSGPDVGGDLRGAGGGRSSRGLSSSTSQ
ncbi:MAG: hypothetical protein Ct9H300mP12_17480 [Acidimicrobiales bacterium]|nr:MAG: hypothetical protein Ct9H300mP12_17480 [Acidimicrobiales bacterium]